MQVYFATMLGILGYLRPQPVSSSGSRAESSDDEVARRSVTFASWRRLGDPNPITFDRLTEKLVQEIR